MTPERLAALDSSGGGGDAASAADSAGGGGDADAVSPAFEAAVTVIASFCPLLQCEPTSHANHNVPAVVAVISYKLAS